MSEPLDASKVSEDGTVHRRRRMERKAEAMQSSEQAVSRTHDFSAQRAALNDSRATPGPEDTVSKVSNGRAQRNRRSNRETEEPIKPAEAEQTRKPEPEEDTTEPEKWEMPAEWDRKPSKTGEKNEMPLISRGYKPEAPKKGRTGENPAVRSTTGPQSLQTGIPQGYTPVPSGFVAASQPSGGIPRQPSGSMGTVQPSGPVNLGMNGYLPPQGPVQQPSGGIPRQPNGSMGTVQPSGPVNPGMNGYLPTPAPVQQPSGGIPRQPSGSMGTVQTSGPVNPGMNGYPPTASQPVSQQPNGYPGYMPNGSQNPYAAGQPQPSNQSRQENTPASPTGKRPFFETYAKQLRYVLIGAAALVLVIVLGSFISQQARARAAARELSEYVEPYNELYVPGVYVDGISLEGMNAVQARAMVESNAQQRSNAWNVALTYNGQTVRTISAADLSMTVNVDDVLQEAWAKGHTGTLEQRRAEMQRLQTEPFQGYTANPSGDTSVIDSILLDLKNQVYRAPQDATIASFEPSLTYPFTFNEEVVGRNLDTDSLKEEIYHRLSAMESGSIELSITTTQPNVTVADIKENQLALRGSGTTPISSSSTAERNENIRTAFSKISGSIIQPGATFSFNGVVGPRTEKNGFLPAIEYAYGELSDGIGGGVCQASTTVYLAAVRSGMEILKREPHSDAVSYIEYGKDATVYWYSNHKIDLVFKNTSGAPIYITAAVQSSPTRRTNLICVVNIYGAGMEGISYDIVTQETVIDAPMEPEYVRDKKGEYVTYTDQQKVVRKASPGCSCDSWRVTYKDGKEIDRVFLYNDVYSPKAEKIYVGVTSR